jgi:hypothetical protein
MPAEPPSPTSSARHSAIRLVEVMQREPSADRPPAGDLFVPEPCETDANPALLEQAKGALMLHFGVDSHQAYALLVNWARMSGAPVPTVAHTLMRGICEGNPQTEIRQGPLMRWLEAQLRKSDPDDARLRTAASRREPTHESPRPD